MKTGIRARNVRRTSHLPPTEEILLSDLSAVGLLEDTSKKWRKSPCDDNFYKGSLYKAVITC